MEVPMLSRSILSFATVFIFAACGEKSDTDFDSGGEAAADGGSGDNGNADGVGDDGGDDDGGDDGPADPMTASISGTLVDQSGAPLTSADIKLCTQLQCKTTEPDESGAFAFPDIEGATFAFEVKGHAANSATIMTFIELEMEEVLTFDTPMMVPTFISSDDLGSTDTIEVDGGLKINVTPDYNLPFGTEVEEKLKGVKMDPTTAGLPLDDVSGEMVGLWYLGTWDIGADPAWTFTIDSGSLDGVEAGDTLKVMSGDYFGVSWVDEGTATVGEDGSVTADAGTGISFLSTLVLIKE
jgi:hypothetical protein